MSWRTWVGPYTSANPTFPFNGALGFCDFGAQAHGIPWHHAVYFAQWSNLEQNLSSTLSSCKAVDRPEINPNSVIRIENIVNVVARIMFNVLFENRLRAFGKHAGRTDWFILHVRFHENRPYTPRNPERWYMVYVWLCILSGSIDKPCRPMPPNQWMLEDNALCKVFNCCWGIWLRMCQWQISPCPRLCSRMWRSYVSLYLGTCTLLSDTQPHIVIWSVISYLHTARPE